MVHLTFIGKTYKKDHMYSTQNKITKKSITIKKEPLQSVMCDVIKICLKRRIATRSWKVNQQKNIKRAVEWPILKLGLTNFNLLLVASLLFRQYFMTSHLKLSSALATLYVFGKDVSINQL